MPKKLDSFPLALSTAATIPSVGFGCWKVPREAAADVVFSVIKAGYRHLDCAADYGNEKEVHSNTSSSSNDSNTNNKDADKDSNTNGNDSSNDGSNSDTDSDDSNNDSNSNSNDHSPSNSDSNHKNYFF